jgi:chromosomal replication initiator protein
MNNSFKNKNLNSENLDWNWIQSEMKKKLGSEIYESWLKKIELVEEFNNYIILSVPTRFYSL